jgi:hypothetical protein
MVMYVSVPRSVGVVVATGQGKTSEDESKQN